MMIATCIAKCGSIKLGIRYLKGCLKPPNKFSNQRTLSGTARVRDSSALSGAMKRGSVAVSCSADSINDQHSAAVPDPTEQRAPDYESELLFPSEWPEAARKRVLEQMETRRLELAQQATVILFPGQGSFILLHYLPVFRSLSDSISIYFLRLYSFFYGFTIQFF